ncbi:MBL fold metallo-hydrolase [Natribacillus halophilus]|uniref:Glyoxylase, beta-lactamase superfamily II n=1 Tax=Natribacillus halophilus TaxID=549003 RepID=A0A1G8JAB2_9BACI|nr:MBL fold metallo-hydrolase [Natribacillus halophilus]SDI27570.1 Glyoxylase, beta-lactamase superfamily II [Natribacillus halophilus]
MQAKIEKLASRTYVIDGYDLNLPERTGIYVLDEEELTIIETGPSPSYPQIKNGLEQLGKSLADIQHIIVTHIHLDHAGGCGQLVKDTPEASVHVHPRGKKHLVEPEKLVKGAKAVYGSNFSDLFDPVFPVPEERINVCEDGDRLPVGKNRTLTFYDTPGHAVHHMSIFDDHTQGVFTGDTVGIFYRGIHSTAPLVLPSTSPSQYDTASMKTSHKRIEALKPNVIYFGHFGASDQISNIFQSTATWLERWIKITREVADEQGSSGLLSERLLQSVIDIHGEKADDSPAWKALKMDCHVSALGLYQAHEKGRL